MAKVIEATAGKTRDLPIKASLREILSKAADAAGIDTVVVTSGGQARKGSGGKRTGSTRHDDGNAADLELRKGGLTLNFERPQDRVIVSRFVTEASRLGATGIGAGVDYMGPTKLHVGFGSKATWGGPKARAADAPTWLRQAVAAAASAPARTLRKGDRGDDVRALQSKLGIAADGVFGPGTEAAVKAYQSGRSLVADGIVGPATRAALGL